MPRKQPEAVTPEWLALMEAALTEEVCRVALRYAWGRVELMRRADVVVQEDEAFALANDAVADTMTRVRVWDPARVALATHLCGAMRSRTNARIARVRKLRLESIHEVDDTSEVPVIAEASLAREAGKAPAEVRMSLVAVAGRVLDGLRSSAEGDGDVLAILGAYGDGVVSRQEIVDKLGWDVGRSSMRGAGSTGSSGACLRTYGRQPPTR